MLTAASATLQGALKNRFGEVVVVCDMPTLFELTSLHSCQQWFLWTDKKVDHDPQPVIGLVLQVRNGEKFFQTSSLESLDLSFFFTVSKQGPCLAAIEEDADNRRLV